MHDGQVARRVTEFVVNGASQVSLADAEISRKVAHGSFIQLAAVDAFGCLTSKAR